MALVGIAVLIGLLLLVLFSETGRAIGGCLLRIVIGIIVLGVIFFLLPVPLLAGLFDS